MHEKGFHLGAGAVIVFSEERNIADVVSSLLGFFRYNSCGKCVPCRVGTTLLTQMASQVKEKGADRDAILSEMLKQAKMMAGTSLCAVGQSPVMPLGSAMKYFRNDF
jgi:NADH:ubiquinone oxidoreductase subunit F (NADH-binding)